MIARLRGEHQDHWPRWRYLPARSVNDPPPAPVAVEDYDEPLVDEDPGAESPLIPRGTGAGRFARALVVGWICLRLARRLTRWLTLLVVVSVAYVAISWVVHQLTPRAAALPATPRAWLTAYEGAALASPGEVCSQLFSPQLAATYAHSTRKGCRAWFGRMTGSSVTVRRVLEQGKTAVLELHQTLSHQNWSVVLDHQADGWQAVDVLGY